MTRPDEEGGSDSESSDEDLTAKQKTRMIARLTSLLEDAYDTTIGPHSLRKKVKRKKRRAKTRVPESSTVKASSGVRVHHTKLNYSKGLSRALDAPRLSNNTKKEVDRSRGISNTQLAPKVYQEPCRLVPFGCGERRFHEGGPRKTAGGEA